MFDVNAWLDADPGWESASTIDPEMQALWLVTSLAGTTWTVDAFSAARSRILRAADKDSPYIEGTGGTVPDRVWLPLLELTQPPRLGTTMRFVYEGGPGIGAAAVETGTIVGIGRRIEPETPPAWDPLDVPYPPVRPT